MPDRLQRRTRGEGVTAPGDSLDVRRHKWLEYYRELAPERGGRCLSREYVGAHDKLRWRCADGHEWEAVANSIRHGRWCPACKLAHQHDETKARMFLRVQVIARATAASASPPSTSMRTRTCAGAAPRATNGRPCRAASWWVAGAVSALAWRH